MNERMPVCSYADLSAQLVSLIDACNAAAPVLEFINQRMYSHTAITSLLEVLPKVEAAVFTEPVKGQLDVTC